MADDDGQLVEAARGGDRAAIDALLARYEPSIYRFGLRMCGDEEAARDVLQETMLAAFRNLPAFRGDASLSTWLYQIARSFCIKQRRRPQPNVAEVEIVDGTAAADAQLHAQRIGLALADAIAALPDDQREVILLRDVEGLTAPEAADVIGIEVGALKSRLHRARMTLRDRLAGLIETGEQPCPELAHELAAYAAAEIDQTACAQIEAHLATCSRCAGACESLKRTVSLCKSLPGNTVPSNVRDAVRSAIRDTMR